MLKSAWSGQSALVVCVAWLALSLANDRAGTLRSLCDVRLLVGAVLTGAGNAASCGCYLQALSYTSLAQVRRAGAASHALPRTPLERAITNRDALDLE